MSRYYEFKCTDCGLIELRYSNSSRCRHCGWNIIRIPYPTADEQIMELRSELERVREDNNIMTDAFMESETIDNKGQLRGSIVAIQKEVEQLREENRWIPVSERLPEEGYSVLVITVREDMWVMHIYHDGTAWCDENTDNFLHIDDITHWRPLPTAPEEG